MGRRRFHRYTDPTLESHFNEAWLRGSVDGHLANGCVANYSEARRNLLARTFNTPAAFAVHNTAEGPVVPWTTFPLDGRIARPGAVRVAIRFWTNSELAANKVTCAVRIGASVGYLTLANASVGGVWTAVTFDITDATENDWCTISFTTEGTNNMVVYSVEMWQPGLNTPAWVALSDSGSLIAGADLSDNALGRKILVNAVKRVRTSRVRRSNVYAHWYLAYSKTGTAYGAGMDDLGDYKFVKRAGVATLWVHYMALVSAGTSELTATLSGSSFSDAAGVDSLVQQTAAAGWKSLRFDMTGTDITDELELRIKFDMKSLTDAAYTSYLPGIGVTEASIAGGAVAHVVPDIMDYLPGTIDEAIANWDGLRDTLDHLWRRGGLNIALSDWRSGESVLGQDAFDALSTSVNKYGGGPNASVLARALAYPSTSARRIRTRLGYVTTAGEAYVKYVQTQYSEGVGSLGAAVYDAAGPLLHRADGILARTLASEEAALGVDSWLPVTAADVELPSGALIITDLPATIWVLAWTENVLEYIIPKWVTIEEISLSQDEFP